MGFRCWSNYTTTDNIYGRKKGDRVRQRTHVSHESFPRGSIKAIVLGILFFPIVIVVAIIELYQEVRKKKKKRNFGNTLPNIIIEDGTGLNII